MYHFEIKAMHCMSCYRNFEDALQEFDASVKIEVDIKNHRLNVDSSQSIEKIKNIIEEAGYPIDQIISDQ